MIYDYIEIRDYINMELLSYIIMYSRIEYYITENYYFTIYIISIEYIMERIELLSREEEKK